MPTFYTEDLDIEVDDFLDDCSSSEIQEVIQWLKDSDYLPQNVATSEAEQSFQDAEFDGALMNLVGKRFKLTTEQEELIINLSKQIL
jgi:hypothetical protein